MRNFAAALTLILIVAGCSGKSRATYQVGHDSDHFTEVIDGKIVRYANWELSVEKKVIPIPHKPSTIIVERDRQHVHIDVNGKTVYED